jgi:cytochrome oxidase Cu insertion factor (SCO1/SenC/PrrC family)
MSTELHHIDTIANPLPAMDYNFTRFRPQHLLADARRSLRRVGVRPGEPAPDFELPTADGRSVRLSQLRGKPVLLHFGSFT